jgi:hypothetical protein
MQIHNLVVFAIWLVLALIGGALIVLGWECLCGRYSRSEPVGGEDT